MAKRVVFDTNVLISAYLWKGSARRALDRVRGDNWTLLVSNDALAELIRVFAYEKFGLKPEDIAPIIDDLTSISQFIEVKSRIETIKADPTDNIFWLWRSMVAPTQLSQVTIIYWTSASFAAFQFCASVSFFCKILTDV